MSTTIRAVQARRISPLRRATSRITRSVHRVLAGVNQYLTETLPVQFAKVYNYLLDVSIITRWIIFIIPVLGLLWIPGILGFTAYPDTTVCYMTLS